MIREKTIVECDNCGKKLERPAWKMKANDHHFCNRTCCDKWRSERFMGENNPSWNGGKEAIICKQCGDVFYKAPSEVQYRTKICSKKCANDYYVGENSSSYGKDKTHNQIRYNCDFCGELNKVSQSLYKQSDHHFCDSNCYHSWVKLQESKQDKEALKSRHCHSIRKWRKLCKERDNHECQICSNDMDLRVHHIKSFLRFPELRFNLDNGITLCETCHRKFHSIYGIRQFTHEDFNKFMSNTLKHIK